MKKGKGETIEGIQKQEGIRTSRGKENHSFLRILETYTTKQMEIKEKNKKKVPHSKVSKVSDLCRGWSESSLFNSYYSKV